MAVDFMARGDPTKDRRMSQRLDGSCFFRMSEAAPEILLVTPVWNDSSRLDAYGTELAAALAAADLPVRWVIADDGSDVSEVTPLTRLRGMFAEVYPEVHLHFARHHRGKGSVVREAWALEPQAEWLAFVDADGSVNAADLLGLLRAAREGGLSVLAVRERTETTQIEESLFRGLAHRMFLWTARILLGLKARDPQCGAKVLRGEDVRAVAPVLVENGLAFDSELLAHLARQGTRWREIPVNWVEKKGGKVHPFRDAWGMLAALLRVRARLGRTPKE
jgi:hypothetical protein